MNENLVNEEYMLENNTWNAKNGKFNIISILEISLVKWEIDLLQKILGVTNSFTFEKKGFNENHFG